MRLALVLGAGDDLPPAKLGVALDLGLRPREVRARLVELRLCLAFVERRENGALFHEAPALDAHARDLPVAFGGDVGGLVGGESARHLEDARQNAALDRRAMHEDGRRRRSCRRGVHARAARAAGAASAASAAARIGVSFGRVMLTSPFGPHGRSVVPDLDAPLVEERPGRTREVGQRFAVVRQRGGLGERRLREVVLPGEDEEVRREPDAVALLLGAQLRLGRGASGLRRVDALGGGVERHGGVAHLDGHALALLGERRQSLALLRVRDRDVASRDAVQDRHGDRNADRRVRKTPFSDRAEGAAEAAVQRVGHDDGPAGESERGRVRIQVAGEAAPPVRGDEVDLGQDAVPGEVRIHLALGEPALRLGDLRALRVCLGESGRKVDAASLRFRRVRRQERLVPERVGGVVEEKELEGELGALGGLLRGVEVALPPFELGERLCDVGLGKRADLDLRLRVRPAVRPASAHARCAHGWTSRRAATSDPVRALHGRDGVRDRAAQRRPCRARWSSRAMRIARRAGSTRGSAGAAGGGRCPSRCRTPGGSRIEEACS